MKINGLLSVKIPVQDFEYTVKWLKNVLNYQKVFGDFFYETEYNTEKLTIIVNVNGGLPVIFSQDLSGETQRQGRPNFSCLGILALKYRTDDIQKLYLKLKVEKEVFVAKLLKDYPTNKSSFWLSDHEGNLFQITQEKESQGLFGVIVNVDNIDEAVAFFKNMGFEKTVFTGLGYFQDLEPLGLFKKMKARRVILRASPSLAMADFIGCTEIDLIQIMDSYPRKLCSKYTLYFSASQAYKRPDFFEPQYKVIDNESILAVVAPVNNAFVKTNVVEIRTLRFDYISIDMLKNQSRLTAGKIRLLLKNVLENID